MLKQLNDIIKNSRDFIFINVNNQEKEESVNELHKLLKIYKLH